MKQIYIDMLKDHASKRYQFTFCRRETSWLARLQNPAGGIVCQFCRGTIDECFESLVGSLPRLGLVASISATKAESVYVDLFHQKLQKNILLYRFSCN